MKYCENCGSKNNDYAKFCANCAHPFLDNNSHNDYKKDNIQYKPSKYFKFLFVPDSNNKYVLSTTRLIVFIELIISITFFFIYVFTGTSKVISRSFLSDDVVFILSILILWIILAIPTVIILFIIKKINKFIGDKN